MINEIGVTLATSLNGDIQAVISFIPRFLAGVILLLIGIIISSVVKQIIESIFQSLKIETLLRKYGVPEVKGEYSWTNIFAEIGRWFVIIIFLVPTADVWRMPTVGNLLNQVLSYIPNVFVAVVIAVVGFVIGKIAHDLVLASTKGITNDTAKIIAAITQWAINIFVILAVLNQLGVASDMVKIFFTGVVAMFAVAGGIAFGLGGQDTARDILHVIRKNIK
jgi:hypothetical protein